MLFYLAFKNIVSRKSSFVIVLFIAFAVMLMAVINSVFDSTENGIEKVFSKSFTGDLAIFPKSDIPLSLFGDETPVTGTLTKINTLVPFNEISKEHAYKEGEGDKSLDYWKRVHEDFFSKCLNEVRLKFTPDMKVVCEEFVVVEGA